LHELTEAIDSQWIKDNALFAYNRIMEVKERFRYYKKTLSDMLAEHQAHNEDEKEGGDAGVEDVRRRDKKEVRIARTLLTQLSQEGEEEPDAVLLENKAIETTPLGEEGVTEVKLRHPKVVPSSLMYDDTGKEGG
jgi:hypothetical protein